VTRILCIALALASGHSLARADEVVALPVVFHGAELDVATADAWLQRVNEPFAAAGVRFVRERLHAIDTRRLPDNRARHRLKQHFVERRVNVFVVDEIRDPWPSQATRRAAALAGREASGYLGGAHIRTRARTPNTYVIVLRRAIPYGALTHELGHFLGAPHHPDPENIMSYGRDRHRFDEVQIATFRRRARRLLRRHEIAPGRPADEPGEPEVATRDDEAEHPRIDATHQRPNAAGPTHTDAPTTDPRRPTSARSSLRASDARHVGHHREDPPTRGGLFGSCRRELCQFREDPHEQDVLGFVPGAAVTACQDARQRIRFRPVRPTAGRPFASSAPIASVRGHPVSPDGHPRIGGPSQPC